MLYADGLSKVGEVKVYRCPICKDGELAIRPGITIEDATRALTEATLAHFHGNKTHTAKALGMGLRSLQRKIKEWEPN